MVRGPPRWLFTGDSGDMTTTSHFGSTMSELDRQWSTLMTHLRRTQTFFLDNVCFASSLGVLIFCSIQAGLESCNLILESKMNQQKSDRQNINKIKPCFKYRLHKATANQSASKAEDAKATVDAPGRQQVGGSSTSIAWPSSCASHLKNTVRRIIRMTTCTLCTGQLPAY